MLLERFCISIHALREEGDDQRDIGAFIVEVFQSTPSARRATQSLLLCVRAKKTFQSTPSARRATGFEVACGLVGFISIHALREEGDYYNAMDDLSQTQFQSTPSARRATPHRPELALTIGDFNPRPPRGGRLTVFDVLGDKEEFQSTPSARRATSTQYMVLEDTLISIHALREEGDSDAYRCATRRPDFNPRPPRGGRPNTRCGAMAGRRFQSTPSARRATTGQGTAEACRLISIHALREEGDPLRPSLPAFALYFNPRPPRGGRPRQAAASVPQCGFQSTPSARRATRRPGRKPGSCAISIHALREEGDLQSGMWSMANTIFQSTPSARRATQPPEFVLLVFIVFQSTPSARRATHL